MRTVTKIILNTILIGVILLSTTNIVVQLQTVGEAKKKNIEIKNQILSLEEENLRLENKISFATSSAFLREQVIDKLGLGTENDYWLILPNDTLNIDITPKVDTVEITPVWKQWLLLFTR